jgi:hypothetical protein
MMRIATLVAVSLVVLTAPVSKSYAADEPPTCLGQSATIVGGDGLVTGTDGADVIVASGISTVDALGGDDLVCLEMGSVVLGASEESPVAKVNAGPGDDVVSSENLDAWSTPQDGQGWEVTVALGTGEDRFLGGPGVDMVYGSDPDGADIERDDITTGDGSDYVYSGHASANNDDVIKTGPGYNWVFMVPPSPAGVLDVRRGFTNVRFDLTTAVPTHWRLDVADRTVRRGAAIGTWDGNVPLWVFDADDGDETSTFAMSGTGGGDQVILEDGLDQFATTVKLGGGTDLLDARGKPEAPAMYALGRDRDYLSVRPSDASGALLPGAHVRVNLATGRLTYGAGRAAAISVIRGVEDVTVAGTKVRVLGDSDADTITVDGCDATVRAGAGHDHVSVVVSAHYGAVGCTHTSRIEGGPGSDELVGADKSTDVLFGGHGRDLADGRGGTDTCRAEITRHCEML